MRIEVDGIISQIDDHDEDGMITREIIELINDYCGADGGDHWFCGKYIWKSDFKPCEQAWLKDERIVSCRAYCGCAPDSIRTDSDSSD